METRVLINKNFYGPNRIGIQVDCIRYINCIFNNIDFKGVVFFEVTFKNCYFKNCNFNKAIFYKVSELHNCYFIGATSRESKLDANFINCRFDIFNGKFKWEE